MKLTICLLIMIICGGNILAQTTTRARISGNNQSNLLIDNARFVIFKLNENATETLKLDRYTGKTFIYGISGGFFNATRKWILMTVRGGLPVAPADSVPRYEFFAGGDGYFLLNSETGQTWILNQRTWEPIPD